MEKTAEVPAGFGLQLQAVKKEIASLETAGRLEA